MHHYRINYFLQYTVFWRKNDSLKLVHAFDSAPIFTILGLTVISFSGVNAVFQLSPQLNTSLKP